MKNLKVLLAVVLLVMMVIAIAMLLHNDQQKRTKSRPVSKPPAVKIAKQARPTVKTESARPKPTPVKAMAGKGGKEQPPAREAHKKGHPHAGEAAPMQFVIIPPAETADKTVPAHVAREALKLVGSDPVAETIWIDAINNPALPPADRKNLIEDLNEAGFADPKNPSEAELPLIQHRLALIEKLAQTPMDPVNAAAFNEAYKDLKAMATRLTQPPAQPQPDHPAMQAQPEQPAAQAQPIPEQPQPDQPQPQPEQPAPQP